MSVAEKPRRRRGSARTSLRELRSRTPDTMLPGLSRGLPLTEPLDDDQIRRIDHESMRILEEVGVMFRDPIALQQWKDAGAHVEGELVKFDRGMIRELISSIPSEITYHARNPEKNVDLGGNNSIFVPMTGAPFLRDLEDKRRWPTLNDLGISTSWPICCQRCTPPHTTSSSRWTTRFPTGTCASLTHP